MPDIVILAHHYDSFAKSSYWLNAISEYWKKNGIRTSVVSDPRVKVEADAAILHVDLTVVPPEYLDFIRRYRVGLNGGVADISKRSISTHLLDCSDRYPGSVIVKTDRNSQGLRERRIATRIFKSSRGRNIKDYCFAMRERFRQTRRRWRHGSAEAFENYPIFNSITDVPEAIWSDPDLVVERFLPERRNGHYCVRTWLFLGNQERNAIFYSQDPVIKSHNIVHFERTNEVPDELRQMRRDLNFDFGKFDYAVVDGKAVLFDANRTPTIGTFPEERYGPIAQLLANGLGSFL